MSLISRTKLVERSTKEEVKSLCVFIIINQFSELNQLDMLLI